MSAAALGAPLLPGLCNTIAATTANTAMLATTKPAWTTLRRVDLRLKPKFERVDDLPVPVNGADKRPEIVDEGVVEIQTPGKMPNTHKIDVYITKVYKSTVLQCHILEATQILA
jgi:hypothetical protein